MRNNTEISSDTNKKEEVMKILHNLIEQNVTNVDALSEQLPTPELHKTSAGFQGGGAKGAAYAGAIEAYGKFGLLDELKRVMGSSAGALTAFLIAIGLDHEQFKSISLDTRLSDLKDAKDSGYFGKFLFANIAWGVFAGGMTTGANAKLLINYLLKQTTGTEDCTFLEFENYRLYGKPNPTEKEKKDSKYAKDKIPAHPEMKKFACTAYHHDQGKDIYLNDKNYKDAFIADALYCSMALPPVFPAAQIRYKKSNGEIGKICNEQYFRDGGIADNLPLDVMNKELTEDENAAPSSELIGFGLVNTAELAKFNRIENYKKSIPSATVEKLELPEEVTQPTPLTTFIDAANAAVGTLASVTVNPVARAVFGGGTNTNEIKTGAASLQQLIQYIMVNGKATKEFETMLKYSDCTVPLYNADIDAANLDINKDIIDTLVHYGYEHTAHWININSQFTNVAESPEKACPVATALLKRYKKLTKKIPTSKEVDSLLQDICTTIVKEIQAYRKYLSNQQNKDTNLTGNIRLNFLGNLVNCLQDFAVKSLSINIEAFKEKITSFSAQALDRHEELQNIITTNRAELFAKISLSEQDIQIRLWDSLMHDTDQEFCEKFSYLLSRSFEFLLTDNGIAFLRSAKAKDEPKYSTKFQHMMVVSINNLEMLHKRFPLGGIQAYLSGYITQYASKEHATKSADKLAEILNDMMFDSAKSGCLTMEDLKLFVALGTDVGIKIDLIDGDGKNVLHHCMANAKSATDVELIIAGLQELAKNNSLSLMSVLDNKKLPPIAYLNPEIFKSPEVVQVIMKNPNIKKLCTDMVQNNASKGAILYAAINSGKVEFFDFIMNMLDGVPDKTNISFNDEKDSLYLCAARKGDFVNLNKLKGFSVQHTSGWVKNLHNTNTDEYGKNVLHYMMEKVTNITEAKYMLEFICWGKSNFFDKSTRNLLCARDAKGNTPLHYLLTEDKNKEVIKCVIETLSSYSAKHAIGSTWYLDQIIDHGILLSIQPMFTLDRVCPNMLHACNTLGFEFVRDNIIPCLSSPVQEAFARYKEIYQTGGNELHKAMKNLSSLEAAKTMIESIKIQKPEVLIGKVLTKDPIFTISDSTRVLLCMRDAAGKTPLHYLLEGTNENQQEIVGCVFSELSLLGRWYGGVGRATNGWTVEDLVDYNVPDNLKMFNSSFIMEVCNKFGVDFVDKAIIPYLSSNTKNDFKIIQDGFNKKSTNLLSSSKPLLLSVSSKRSSQEPEGEEPKGESPKPNNSPRSTG